MQREVAPDGPFEEEAPAVDLDDLLAVLDRRAEPGRRQHPAEAGAPGADAFDQRALRHKLHLEITRHHPALRDGVEPDMRHDGAAHLPRERRACRCPCRAGRGRCRPRSARPSPVPASASIRRWGEPTPMKPPTSRTAPSPIIAAAASGEIAVFMRRAPSCRRPSARRLAARLVVAGSGRGGVETK